jgi:hypothetical protein
MGKEESRKTPPVERAVKRGMGFVVLKIPNKHKVHCTFFFFTLQFYGLY